MRERNQIQNLQLLGWSMVDEPRTPPTALESGEGWRLLQREVARCRRYGGTLSILSIQAGGRIGSRLAALVRDCDFVAQGNPGELLIALPGSDEKAAVGCAARVLRELIDVRNTTLGYAQLGENESVESLVERARNDRDVQPVRSAA